jgi:hypothetical protein
MAQITLCEGQPTFEGRANGEYLVVKFPDSDNGIMLSRHEAIILSRDLKRSIFESFENPQAEILTFHRTGSPTAE